MKPWEETWTFDGEREGGCILENDTAVMYTCGPDDPEYHAPRGHLASAAPDMARVLLEIEWRAGEFGDPDAGGRCPSCLGYEPSGSPDDGHHVDCALDAALRKAGVR